MKNLTNIFLAGMLMMSCQTTTNSIKTADEDLSNLEKLMDSQSNLLIGKIVEKKVTLDGQSETLTLNIDTDFVDQELKILGGKRLENIFLNGGYDKYSEGSTINFVQKVTEKQGPLALSIEMNGNQVSKIVIEEETKNTLFLSNVASVYTFQNGRLHSYKINGLQNIFGRSGSNYSIKGKILN